MNLVSILPPFSSPGALLDILPGGQQRSAPRWRVTSPEKGTDRYLVTTVTSQVNSCYLSFALRLNDN